MKHALAEALLLVLVLGLAGCSYMYESKPSKVLYETDFTTCPDWVKETSEQFVSDGALHLVDPYDEGGGSITSALPIEVDEARTRVEFGIVDPRGPRFAVGYYFRTQEGDPAYYFIWIYQNGSEGDSYILRRIDDPSIGWVTISEGPIQKGLLLSGPNATELDIANDSLLLWLNGDLVYSALESEIGAVGKATVKLTCYNVTLAVDYLRVESLE